MTALLVRGETPTERVLWASLWAPGPNGRRGLPFVLVGDPGTTKTAKCRHLAREAGLPFSSLLASIRQPMDFLGMPMMSQDALDQPVTTYAPAGWAVSAARSKRAVILLDEVNTAPPAVQAALLRLLFEGVCGELELPPDVRMMLAMNETEDAAGGWDIAPPLANRVGWLRWDPPSVPGWIDYMQRGGGCRLAGQVRTDQPALVDPVAQEMAVDQLWSVAWAYAVGVVGGFLQAKPHAAHAKPMPGVAGSRAWPSVRTWDFATCGLAACEVFGLGEEERRLCLEAFVGQAASVELRTWERFQDLPRAADVLAGTAVFEHQPTRLDRTAAVLTSCTALVVGGATDDLNKRQCAALWKLLGKLPDAALDLALPSAKSLQKAGKVVGFKESYSSLARLLPLMEAAGVGQ